MIPDSSFLLQACTFEELLNMLAEAKSMKYNIPILFNKFKRKNHLNSLKSINTAMDYRTGIGIIGPHQDEQPTAFWWPLKKGRP